MVEAVEKSMDDLIKGDRNSEAYRRMSNQSGWSKGKSKLNRRGVSSRTLARALSTPLISPAMDT